ncbi:efflux transporter periplasmic adaptor subunit [Massilia eurypsychrophila]|jgi:membrane fusion protein (multidrug efflux system)|uniref:Efflux transporter periplasmic adaptor subunit n=1 Tax=Massilia eurypsychrophila TaxID=1485217 RepID=A0A2G8TJ28_9BURK|nr:efflux RND transporter periplasmic adaptor subunit [Massilia eurypsychrophila]PIL46055.1 efflux transporter periplasmic adaptor subunit [Massilia eurypsychrophila]
MKIETLPLAQAHPTTRPRRWKKPVAALLIVLLAGGGYAYLQKSKAPAATTAQATDGKDGKDAPKVDVYELSSADVAAVEAREVRLDLSLSGSLAPLTQATIKSKVSGVVTETAVQEGMNVAAGQVIARLDAADQRARVAQQQAALDEASARLAMAKKNNANSQALLKQNYISQNSYDTTLNSVELAQASVNAMRAQLELARIALADTVIRAPLSGVVSKRHVQAGEKVAPDMSVFTIVNLRQLTLEAQVPASEVPRVKVGQDVRFKVDGFPQRDFAGKVARISPTTEAGSRSMLVYISVDNADGALRGGMFAKGGITTEKTAVTPVVALAALRTEKGQQVVYIVEGNKVVAQPVTLGLRNEDEGMAQVTSGLAEGASVIVARLDGVKPGDKVRIGAAPVAAAAPAPAKG